jgi:hypothetical protein
MKHIIIIKIKIIPFSFLQYSSTEPKINGIQQLATHALQIRTLGEVR